ncbi:MAG: hypothetical protein RL272_979 [Candidatus Parcubacteria bacterium]|jgi:type II secretory pathway pseudopilin PulG
MAIIGTLSAIGVVSYSSARSSARDVKRVSDMKQLQTAIELFFENNNHYPGDGRPGNEGAILGMEKTKALSDAGFGPLLGGTPYMVAVPRNPEPFGSPYVYRALNADGSDCNDDACASYAILFSLEKPQGNYLAGAHAMTPAGIAGAEGGYAGEGVVGAGQQIIGIQAVQASLDVFASRATDQVERFVTDKRVQMVTETAVAPTIAAAAVANTALTTTSAASYVIMFITQPFLLLGRRKRKAWGTVYNALSRLPEDLVIVRIRDAVTNRILKSTVTDMQGRFSFLMPRGSYRIEAAKAKYAFPSLVTAGKKEDGHFADLYHGEVLDVGPEGAVLTPNIPLDPTGGDVPDAAVLKKDFWKRVNRGVAILSPTLGGISLLIRPSLFVALLFGAQLVIYLLFRRIAEPPQPKNWGIVYEQGSQKPVSQAILRIFEAKYNKLLETQVTDRQGRYHFRVGSNVYYLTVTKPGYLKTETDPLDLTQAAEATVIASDLPLQPSKAAAAKKNDGPPEQPGYAPSAPPSPPAAKVPQAAAPPQAATAATATPPAAAAPQRPAAPPAQTYEERMMARLKRGEVAVPPLVEPDEIPADDMKTASSAPAAPADASSGAAPGLAAAPDVPTDEKKKPPSEAWFRDV